MYTVNGALPEVPPPGVGVDIATRSVPTAETLSAGISEVIPLVPTKMLVGSGEPFHSTNEQGAKPLPFTVSGTGGPATVSTAALAGDIGDVELRIGAGNVDPVGSAVRANFAE